MCSSDLERETVLLCNKCLQQKSGDKHGTAPLLREAFGNTWALVRCVMYTEQEWGDDLELAPAARKRKRAE